MLSAEQLERRKSTLGSSEIAAIVGADPWKTPLDVWMSKTGRGVDVHTEQTDIGDALEEPIARLAARRLGAVAFDKGETFVHGRYPWVAATPDFLLSLAMHQARRVLEIKNVGHRMASKWGDEDDGEDGVPMRVQLQTQWQVEVCDIEHAHVAALIGGRDLRVYPVRRDRDLAADLLTMAADWWRKHVLADVPPDPDGTERYAEYLYTRHPRALGTVRDASPDEERLLYALRSTQARRKQAEEDEARVKQELMARIGDDRGIAGAAGRVVWSEIAPCAVPATTRKAHRKLMPRWNEED